MVAPAPDPIRPYRSATYGVYTAIATAFCLFVTFNVVRSVRAMTPSLPAAATPLPDEVCAQHAARLWDALEEHRRALSASPAKAEDPSGGWTEFRVSWLRELRGAQAGCAGEQRPALAGLFRDLEKLENLYATHAVQYTGEIGPTVSRFREALASQRVGKSTE